jgi:hypothetical protein
MVVRVVIIDSKEKYRARYVKRGLKRQVVLTTSVPQWQGGKPNHKERAVDIATCFPLIGR